LGYKASGPLVLCSVILVIAASWTLDDAMGRASASLLLLLFALAFGSTMAVLILHQRGSRLAAWLVGLIGACMMCVLASALLSPGATLDRAERRALGAEQSLAAYAYHQARGSYDSDGDYIPPDPPERSGSVWSMLQVESRARALELSAARARHEAGITSTGRVFLMWYLRLLALGLAGSAVMLVRSWRAGRLTPKMDWVRCNLDEASS